jgi:hypothetical protein
LKKEFPNQFPQKKHPMEIEIKRAHELAKELMEILRFIPAYETVKIINPLLNILMKQLGATEDKR